jgi:lipid-A-disaccharide synthase
MPYKIMMVSGEASGDLHGASVVKALKEQQPDIQIYGVGGQAMAAAGVEILYDIKELGVVGFVEVVKKYPHLLGVFNRLVEVLKSNRPDVLVLIDYPGFNMRLARAAKDLGIKVVYYISPSAWAWARGRAKKIADTVERVAAIFPFEAEVYTEAGANVTFVGHPLLDIVKPSMERAAAYTHFQADANRPIITLMPGSRKQEIENLLPDMLKALEILKQAHPAIQCYLPLASTIARDNIEAILKQYNVDVQITQGHTYDLMGISTFIIAASGTATLEAALMGAPTIIVYRLAPITWLLGKFLVKIPHVGLPNIVAGKRIVPELLQYDVEADNIASIAKEWLDRPENLNLIREDLRMMKTQLGEPGAVGRVAEVILEIAADRESGTVSQ